MNYSQTKVNLYRFFEELIPFDPSGANKIAFLTGPWGVGKTYLVREILASPFLRKYRVFYYSFSGKDSLSSVDQELFRLFAPKRTFFGQIGNSVSLSASLASTVGLSMSVSPHHSFSFFGSQKRRIRHVLAKPFILVFDDLERKASTLENNAVFGLAELLAKSSSENARILFVCNDDAFPDGSVEKRTFFSFKEKICKHSFYFSEPNLPYVKRMLGKERDFCDLISFDFYSEFLKNARAIERADESFCAIFSSYLFPTMGSKAFFWKVVASYELEKETHYFSLFRSKIIATADPKGNFEQKLAYFADDHCRENDQMISDIEFYFLYTMPGNDYCQRLVRYICLSLKNGWAEGSGLTVFPGLQDFVVLGKVRSFLADTVPNLSEMNATDFATFFQSEEAFLNGCQVSAFTLPYLVAAFGSLYSAAAVHNQGSGTGILQSTQILNTIAQHKDIIPKGRFGSLFLPRISSGQGAVGSYIFFYMEIYRALT